MCFQRFVAGVVVVLLAFLGTSIASHAAVPVHDWSQRFGGTVGEQINAIAVDASGNVYLTGAFEGTVNFGGGNLVSAGGRDIVIAKYDASGTHQWSRSFGGTGFDNGNAVAVTASGDLLVSGGFSGTVDLGGGNLVSVGFADLFVAKYDPNGSHLLSRGFGGGGIANSTSITSDASGNIIVAGSYLGTMNLGGRTFHSAGFNDVFVAKYDAGCTHQWSNRYGGFGNDRCFSAAVDPSGNVIITGDFESNAFFGGVTLFSAGDADIYIAKYDATGAHQWSKRYGITLNNVGRGVAVDDLGNVIVTGSGPGLNFGGATHTGEFFVTKFDAAGVYQWSVDAGAARGNSVVVDPSGSVLVTGAVDIANFGGGAIVGASGSQDMFVAKYDANGVHEWSRGYGGSDTDEGLKMALDASGTVLVTGTFIGTANFGGTDLVPAGSGDIFLARYEQENPTPVFISAFVAKPRPGAVDIIWDFTSDEAVDRFVLYRRQGASPVVAITSGDAANTRAYTDRTVQPGEVYHYELVIRTSDGDEYRSPAATATVPALAASLSQNFPNPFNPQTTIEYAISAKALVSIEIFDATGALVTRLEEGPRAPGVYRAVWHGRDLSGRPVVSGIYFYRLSGVGSTEIRKMVLLK